MSITKIGMTCLFRELAAFIWSQHRPFFLLGLALLVIVPVSLGASVLLYCAPLPFAYSCIVLLGLRKTHDFYARFQAGRQPGEPHGEAREFQYTASVFGMALLCNLALTVFFVSVLLATGAEDFYYWCNGDIESVKLSPGFQAIGVLLVSTAIYSLGHVLAKAFFLPALYFLAEKRGGFCEALQFSWNNILSSPNPYAGILFLELPFILGFVFFSLIVMPLGLLFSFATTALFQTSLLNAFSLVVYDKTDKTVVLPRRARLRWFFFGVFVFLLVVSPLIYLGCREATGNRLSRQVRLELLEDEFDRAWSTTAKIPVPAKREEARFEVVRALSKVGRFDRAIACADRIDRDPWDRSIRANQQIKAYRVILHYLILDRRFDRAKDLAERHLHERDDVFDTIRRAEQSSPEFRKEPRIGN